MTTAQELLERVKLVNHSVIQQTVWEVLRDVQAYLQREAEREQAKRCPATRKYVHGEVQPCLFRANHTGPCSFCVTLDNPSNETPIESKPTQEQPRAFFGCTSCGAQEEVKIGAFQHWVHNCTAKQEQPRQEFCGLPIVADPSVPQGEVHVKFPPDKQPCAWCGVVDCDCCEFREPKPVPEADKHKYGFGLVGPDEPSERTKTLAIMAASIATARAILTTSGKYQGDWETSALDAAEELLAEAERRARADE